MMTIEGKDEIMQNHEVNEKYEGIANQDCADW